MALEVLLVAEGYNLFHDNDSDEEEILILTSSELVEKKLLAKRNSVKTFENVIESYSDIGKCSSNIPIKD